MRYECRRGRQADLLLASPLPPPTSPFSTPTTCSTPCCNPFPAQRCHPFARWRWRQCSRHYVRPDTDDVRAYCTTPHLPRAPPLYDLQFSAFGAPVRHASVSASRPPRMPTPVPPSGHATSPHWMSFDVNGFHFHAHKSTDIVPRQFPPSAKLSKTHARQTYITKTTGLVSQSVSI